MVARELHQQLQINRKAHQRLWVNGTLFTLFVLGVITVTSVYISSEHTFYWWDYVTYQRWTRETATVWLESPNLLHKVIETLYRAWQSTSRDYNDLPTLLLFPFLLIFGDSRLVYILSIALVYLLPFALVLGAIAVKLIPSYPRTVYWSTALLTLLTPVVWASTLRGYPDVGGALLIALAILVYLQDVKLKSWKQVVLIGFLIAAAALFRRHFIFDGIAFFGSVVLQSLIAFGIQVKQQSHGHWRNLLKRSVQIGWTATASLVALAVMGSPFVVKVLTTNFHHLYTSYEVSVIESLQYYGLTYGLVAWILAGLGFAFGVQTRVLSRPVATFIVSFSSFLLLQWLLVIRQPNLQYNLHFSLFIVLGLAAFGWTAWNTLKRSTRIIVLSIGGAYLIFNAVISLAPVDLLDNTPIRPTRFNASYSGMGFSGEIVSTQLSTLFSAHYPPLKHPDYDEIVQLVKYLHSVATAEEPIYVVASSELFNESIVIEAGQAIGADGSSSEFEQLADGPLPEQQELQILPSLFIDSGGSYPLESLLQAQYVVVATPFQHHLRVEEQDVLKVAVDAFTENWEIASDFTRLPVQFALAEGAVVKVYKRTRPTSQKTALRTLTAMQRNIGIRPGGQLDWLSLSEVPAHKINRRPIRGNYYLETRNREEASKTSFFYNYKACETSFLYLNALPEHIRIIGKRTHTENWCAGTVLSFDAIDRQGEVINTTKLMDYSTPNFTLPLKTQNAAYLLFNVSIESKNISNNQCSVGIQSLSIEK